MLAVRITGNQLRSGRALADSLDGRLGRSRAALPANPEQVGGKQQRNAECGGVLCPYTAVTAPAASPMAARGIDLGQPSVQENSPESRAFAVRERIGPALTIVDDESLDRHGLHRVRGDANSGMADAGCGAEQDDTLLFGERRGLCHSYSRRQILANAAIAASRVG